MSGGATLKETSLDVVFTAREVPCRDLEGVGVVVVDVLRATTTLTAALAAGAQGVWPVDHPDKARSLGRKLGALVGGEREGLALPGFDLGNSPLEYTREVVAGKPIVLTTSNGTMALGHSRAGRWVIAGCFNNLEAVASHIEASETCPVLIVCAGTDRGSRLSEEDLLFAGALTRRLIKGDPSRWHLEGGAVAAREYAAEKRGSVADAFQEMAHVRYLVDLGLGDDVTWASRTGTSDTVAVMAEDAAGRPYLKALGDDV